MWKLRKQGKGSRCLEKDRWKLKGKKRKKLKEQKIDGCVEERWGGGEWKKGNEGIRRELRKKENKTD